MNLFGPGGVRAAIIAAGVSAAIAISQSAANAQTNTLVNGNSSASINVGSQAGMFNWMVDGQNQLNQQWFWFRVGNSGPQTSIDNLVLTPPAAPVGGFFSTLYTGAQFNIQITYTLVGGAAGSGTADIGEQIKIQNTTGAALPFHFFQYADFNIGGSSANTLVQLGKNLGGLYNEALVTSGNISLTENVDSAIAPGANHGEAALYNSTLNSLTNTPNYTLNGTNSAGPGHATWAFEWDPSIAAGGTFIISKDLNIAGVTPVPEPATWSLMALALAAGSFGLRRKRR